MAEEHGLTAARALLLLRSASVGVFPFGVEGEIIRLSRGRTIGSFVVAFRRAVNGCGLAAPAG
jgi:hypothetical protein